MDSIKASYGGKLRSFIEGEAAISTSQYGYIDKTNTPTLSDLSIRVRESSKELVFSMRSFSEGGPENKELPRPTPLLDPIAEVAGNLAEADANIQVAMKLFLALKERIKN